MDMDYKKPNCPILDVDGVISGGKQFDLDITLPEDNRDVIYGVVKDCFKEPVRDAVVKLVEVVYDCGKEERRPIGHTFTDKEGEFVFGPLCPGKKYALQIWVNDTKKIKICAKCHHEGRCLKGEKHDKCDCFLEEKPHHEDKHCYDEEYYYKERKEYEDKDCCKIRKDHDDKDCCKERKEHEDKDCCKERKDHDDKDCCKERKDHDDKDCCKERKEHEENDCCKERKEYEEKDYCKGRKYY